MLSDPSLDHGCTRIEFAFLEQYRGNQQYWSIVMPPLRALLSATDALLKGGRRKWAGAPGNGAEADAAFRDFWEATTLARLLVADEGKWKVRFAGALCGALTLNEKLAMPGRTFRLVWVTGDATPQRIGTIDWTNRRAAERCRRCCRCATGSSRRGRRRGAHRNC